MMNSLFSSFDPSNSYFNSNYLIMLVIFLLPLSNKVFEMPSRFSHTFLTMNKFMFSELNSTVSNNNKNMKVNTLKNLFLFLLLLNMMGLVPYVFTMTAHMAFTFALAIPLWLSFLLFSIFKNTNHFLSHMVPLSTPLPLSQFMTVIETVSQIIRPITLSVRLAANMTAGHILMALASAPINILNTYSIVLLMLILLELAVAFIQSYVFTILSAMYLTETY